MRQRRNTTDVSAALRLFELAPRVTRMENAVLAEVSPPLTFRQFRLLGRIDEGYTTITRLGRVATISMPAISESVEGLVKKSLVRRSVDPNDRRSATLALTEAGAEALAAGEMLLTAAAERLLEDIAKSRRGPLESDLTSIDERVARFLVHEAVVDD